MEGEGSVLDAFREAVGEDAAAVEEVDWQEWGVFFFCGCCGLQWGRRRTGPWAAAEMAAVLTGTRLGLWWTRGRRADAWRGWRAR